MDSISIPTLRLFLVQGEVGFTAYMADKTKVSPKIRLVWALTEKEAKEKFINHFESMSEDYGDSYWASVDEVSDAIP